MSSSERYERRLPTLLEELSAPRTPDYFDDILGQVGRTRQRPGWTFPERWLPMSAVSERLAAAPRAPVRAIVLVALLAIALVAAIAIIAGSHRRAVPAPFGPALNGVVAYVDDQGAIRAGLPTETTFKVIVPGPGNDRPVFSPDGTQLAYLHTGELGTADIVVSKPDGTDAHTLNPDGLSSIAYLGWTPDGGSVVVGAAPRKLLAFDAAKLGEPALITDQARFTGTVAGLTGFNDHLASLFRPPLGQEIAFIGSGPEGDGLYAMRRDDSSLRPLLTPKTGGVPFVDMGFAEWSPDGTRIAVMLRPPGTPEFATVVYVMNADGTGLERLTQFNDPDWITSENFAAWSPDSSKIAIQHWFNRVNGDVNVRPITIIDVATHEPVELGPISFDGFSSWGWSPDGKSLLTMPHDGSDRVLLVDAAGNGWTETQILTTTPTTWQRTAAQP